MSPSIPNFSLVKFDLTDNHYYDPENLESNKMTL